MRKHFIWLLILSGCGTAGGVEIAGNFGGVSGNGNPQLAGEWILPLNCVFGINGVVVETCLGQIWKFDDRGRLTAVAACGGGSSLELSNLLLSDPPGCFVGDYAANEAWVTPGVGTKFHEGFLHCLDFRVVTESFGQNIRIETIQRATGCTSGVQDFALSVDGNRLISEEFTLVRPEALGARIVSFQWRHPADWKALYCVADNSVIFNCPR